METNRYVDWEIDSSSERKALWRSDLDGEHGAENALISNEMHFNDNLSRTGFRPLETHFLRRAKRPNYLPKWDFIDCIRFFKIVFLRYAVRLN